MTHDDVMALMEAIKAATGCAFAYDHFAEGESPTRRFCAFCTRKRQSSARTTSSTTASTIWTLSCTQISRTRSWSRRWKRC